MQRKVVIIPTKRHVVPLSQLAARLWEWLSWINCCNILSQHKTCRTSPIFWSFLQLHCRQQARVCVRVCLPSGNDSMMYGVAAACYHREQVALPRDKQTTHWPGLMCRRQTEQLSFYYCADSCVCSDWRWMTETWTSWGNQMENHVE